MDFESLVTGCPDNISMSDFFTGRASNALSSVHDYESLFHSIGFLVDTIISNIHQFAAEYSPNFKARDIVCVILLFSVSDKGQYLFSSALSSLDSFWEAIFAVGVASLNYFAGHYWQRAWPVYGI
jgi:hypothetical protein